MEGAQRDGVHTLHRPVAFPGAALRRRPAHRSHRGLQRGHGPVPCVMTEAMIAYTAAKPVAAEAATHQPQADFRERRQPAAWPASGVFSKQTHVWRQWAAAGNWSLDPIPCCAAGQSGQQPLYGCCLCHCDMYKPLCFCSAELVVDARCRSCAFRDSRLCPASPVHVW